MFIRSRQYTVLVLMTALAVFPLSVSQAEVKPTSQEAELVHEEQAINQQSVPKDDARIQALAKQYSVEPSLVQGLQTRTPGWGGVTIQLSMAEELMKQDPKAYPTMNEALAKVEALRAEGKGYGLIAHELGFKLGPVVSDAKHTRNEMRRESSQAIPTPHAENPAHVEKAARSDQPPHPEKPYHPEKPPHPEKPAHP